MENVLLDMFLQKARKKRKNFKGASIAGLVIFILSLIAVAVGVVLSIGLLWFFSAIFAITGAIIIVAGLVGIKTQKKVEENVSNPLSLCYKAYCTEDYKYFMAYEDLKKQKRANRVANMFGALGMMMGGHVIFKSGANSCDLFVGREGIIINSKIKNKAFNDEKFKHMTGAEIKDIDISFVKGHVRAVIFSELTRKKITLDIPAKREADKADILDAFEKLKAN